MKTRHWKAIAIGSAFLGAAIAILGRRVDKQARIPRVALIGDSYAVGLGPKLTELIPDFKFEGHVGTNTAQWAQHSNACSACGNWLSEFKPSIVLVSLGVNDGDAPNAANYQNIVRSLHGVGARVVWIEPPASVKSPEVRTVIASLGVPTVPATRTPLSGDGLHPQSYDQWAHEIARVVS